MPHDFIGASVEAFTAQGMDQDNDYYFNYELWTGNRSNVIFVTGLSGSGKSTLSKRIAEEFNAERFGLDDFFNPNYLQYDFRNTDGPYSQMTPGMKEIIGNFLKAYDYGYLDPDDPSHIVFGRKYLDGSIFEKCKNFVQFITTKYRSKKFVIEGVQIYYTFALFDIVKDYPLIIKGIPTYQAIKRALKRNYNTKLYLYAKIQDFFKNGGSTIEWYNRSAKQLEEFKQKLIAYVPEENQLRQSSYTPK